jgi:hypothetical protein
MFGKISAAAHPPTAKAFSIFVIRIFVIAFSLAFFVMASG